MTKGMRSGQSEDTAWCPRTAADTCLCLIDRIDDVLAMYVERTAFIGQAQLPVVRLSKRIPSLSSKRATALPAAERVTLQALAPAEKLSASTTAMNTAISLRLTPPMPHLNHHPDSALLCILIFPNRH
ncbi:hypothetical protein GCM10011335_37840 [Aureimonas glaciei]|uniref:Uncharacterized protein n=1 Tax=Aureimonas glaciei TaxID=1776957 RepID=A0A917DEG8_9HYPH|nr:hypothetical protein GCM10011335_37840 [Aureimonas glaciei]